MNGLRENRFARKVEIRREKILAERDSWPGGGDTCPPLLRPTAVVCETEVRLAADCICLFPQVALLTCRWLLPGSLLEVFP